uniref:Beta-lactamase domain-containing protein n=1 Tax=Macrostomum lignano TaxID=282301 RepID=A0A1I8J3E5_9PLAT
MSSKGLIFGLLLQLLLLCSSCFGAGQQRQTPELNQAAIRAVLEAAMRCQNLPQVHTAVVHAGIHLYSFRLQLHSNGSDSVLLPLASISKGMFSTALPFVQKQLQADRNDPNFDLLTTPIKQLLGDSDFWFLDHVRTDEVTIEDLTSHTTGLSRHDALSLWSGIKTKAELAELTGRFNATGTFRGSFIYNNLVWTIADLTVERLTGMNFTAYMRKFLWQPLGMNGAVGSSEVDARGLVAKLFRSSKHFGSGPVPFERTDLERTLDIVEAAGGIYAPLGDMVKYMQHHTAANYSSFLPPPPPFKSVNGFNAGPAFDPRLLNYSNVRLADLPDIDTESYGHGWSRQWYRDSLSYEHSGSVFDANCHLRVLPKRRLSVFAHTSLGRSDSPSQSAYANIVSQYITDLLLQNSSYVTQENVCSLLRDNSAEPPIVVPRRLLSQADLQTCVGSFGNYGFGTVSVSENSTSGLLNAAYGSVLYELTPVRLAGDTESQYSFFLAILRPGGFPLPPPVLGSNASHVTLQPGSLNPQLGQPLTPLFLRISSAGQGQPVVINSPAFEATARLEKGLQPDSWRRPVLCPVEPKAAGAVTGTLLATAAAAVAATAAFSG